jgi:hypothetical protein
LHRCDDSREKGSLVRRLLLFALIPNVCFAWGFDGHRRLAAIMHEPLPANHCLRAWYASRQTSQLQDRACDPDRLRGSDPNEAVRHYLEIDWVNPPSNYPRDWQEALEQLRNFATRNGTVPWRVEEQYAGLVAAFRARDVNQVLDRSFFMSHYVTDAFSVLHDTKNFDPNDGLHARWESDMFNVNANLDAITTQARGLYGTPGRIDPRYATFDIVLVGNGLVPTLIAADVAAGGLDAGSGYQRQVLFAQSRELTARRWADAVTVMSSFLWMAWAEAGAPDLPGFTAGCSRAQPMMPTVLRGYPPMSGWTPLPPPRPDAGPDAGRPDAGVDAGVDAGPVGGGSAGGEPSGGGPFNPAPFDAGVAEPMEPVGCQCQSGSGWWLLLALPLLLRRRW